MRAKRSEDDLARYRRWRGDSADVIEVDSKLGLPKRFLVVSKGEYVLSRHRTLNAAKRKAKL